MNKRLMTIFMTRDAGSDTPHIIVRAHVEDTVKVLGNKTDVSQAIEITDFPPAITKELTRLWKLIDEHVAA